MALSEKNLKVCPEMRIMFLTSSLGPGGAERVATSLSNAWVDRGDQVLLMPTFSGGGDPFYPLKTEVDLCYLESLLPRKSGRKRYVKRLLTLRNKIKSWQPDIVLSFLPNVNVAAILATRGLGIPCVIGERSDPKAQPIGSFWSFAANATYRFTDVAVVQTEAMAHAIQDVYSGLDRVHIISNPIPEEALEHRVNPNVDRSRKILLSLGRLSKEKNIDHILKAFGDISPQYPDWDLHIYGDGPDAERLREFAAAYPCDRDRIVFKGRTSNPWSIMAEADAFVMASSYEGFPNALLEAMVVGLACISSDCPSGPREITDQGQAGLLFSPGSHKDLVLQLHKLLGNPSLRADIGAKARTHALDHYGLTTVLEKWDAAFAAAIANYPTVFE